MPTVDPSPKVSVIVAVYNSARFLNECIDSILAQTLTEFELICVDDGSTDDSGTILDDYAKRDSRVNVIHQANAGAGPARNKGLEIARGEYLSFLDADDMFAPQMLELAYAHAKEQDDDICIFRTEHYDQQTSETGPATWTLKAHRLPSSQPFSWKENKAYIFQFCIGWAWDKLFKTSFIRETGLTFPALRQSNDMSFVYGALAKANRIGWIDDILVTQRRNVTTSLSNTRSKSPLCFYQSLQLLKDDLVSTNTYKEVEQSFVNWALEFTLWHLGSLDHESKELILKKMAEEGWDQLGITNRPSDYFYQWRHYRDYQRLRYNIEWSPEPKKLTKGKKLRYRILAAITWGRRKRHYLNKLGK